MTPASLCLLVQIASARDDSPVRKEARTILSTTALTGAGIVLLVLVVLCVTALAMRGVR